MKKSWYGLLDNMKLPLMTLLIGALFASVGSIQTENATLSTIFNGIGYLGMMMKRLFPMALTITLVGRKYEDSITVFVALVCYILLQAVTMFASSHLLDSYFYNNFLSTTLADGTMIYPVNIGLFSAIFIYFIIHYAYKISRKRYNYGMLMFINNDGWFLITAVLFTVVTGLSIAFVYPHVAKYFTRVITFISVRSTNPAMMFVYTIIEKILNFFGLHGFIEKTFWLGELGGSWIDVNKITHLGDVNIWTAQYLADSIAKGTGKYITLYYITNLFIVPSLIIGYFLNIHNKIDRQRMIGLAIVGLIASVISGSSLPLEFLLLFSAPGLLVMHIIVSGGINMLLSILNVQLGYTLSGDIAFANVGNVFDFASYFGSISLHDSALTVLYVGIGAFVFYQIIIFIYYRFMSQDFMESAEGRVEMKHFAEALGGFGNIEMITSSPVSIIAVLKDNDKLNADIMMKGTRALKITERYFGYYIDYGPGSSELCRKIKREMKDYEDCIKFHPQEEK